MAETYGLSWTEHIDIIHDCLASMTQAPFERPLASFEGPKELINGAKESIAELELICNAISETRDYEIIIHSDPKTREKIVKIRLKTRFPLKIQRVVSSIIKELKLALDQAFCDGAVALGRPHKRGIYFPFGKDPENLEATVRNHCKNVDRRLIDYCLSFKPYYGGDGNKILWSMSSLAGSTHQGLIGVGFEDRASFHQAIVSATGQFQLIINKWNRLHNELEVARISPDSALHIDSNFTLRLNIIFAKRSHALSFRPVVGSLHELISIVEGIIFGIEAEITRILRERST